MERQRRSKTPRAALTEPVASSGIAGPLPRGDRLVAPSQAPLLDLVTRLEQGRPADGRELVPATGTALSTPVGPRPTVDERLDALIGCRTSEVSLAILTQVVNIEETDLTTVPDGRIDALFTNAAAMLAELEPDSVAETLFAAQMVVTQRLAMTFMRRTLLVGQGVAGVDANVLRAVRLTRVFNEKVEAMAKLKGKSGQQRVVVEHVSGAAGGQAVVGLVTTGGKGAE